MLIFNSYVKLPEGNDWPTCSTVGLRLKELKKKVVLSGIFGIHVHEIFRCDGLLIFFKCHGLLEAKWLVNSEKASTCTPPAIYSQGSSNAPILRSKRRRLKHRQQVWRRWAKGIERHKTFDLKLGIHCGNRCCSLTAIGLI